MQKFELYSIWEAERVKDTYVYPQTHSYYELVYYPSGKGVAKVGDTTYGFGPDTFIIIPPGVVHDEARHNDCKILCLSFGCNGKSLEMFHCVDDSKKIYKVLKEILKESVNQSFGYQEMIEAKMKELFVRIARLQNTQVAASKNFEYVIYYLKENFHEKIQMSDCAKQLNLSYDYFQHKFKQLTGHSPQNFLLEQRLQAAEELLLQNEYSCTEIAYRCGFSTSAQFSMLFKKKHGLSPQQYKKQKLREQC